MSRFGEYNISLQLSVSSNCSTKPLTGTLLRWSSSLRVQRLSSAANYTRGPKVSVVTIDTTNGNGITSGDSEAANRLKGGPRNADSVFVSNHYRIGLSEVLGYLHRKSLLFKVGVCVVAAVGEGVSGG